MLKREVQRKRLIKLFESKGPIWQDEDHPELEKGADEWVRQMRQESETRLLRLDIDGCLAQHSVLVPSRKTSVEQPSRCDEQRHDEDSMSDGHIPHKVGRHAHTVRPAATRALISKACFSVCGVGPKQLR